MISLDKILGLAGIGSTIANVSMLKRFLSGIVVVVAFTALAGTMAGLLLTAGLYELYLSLIAHGLQEFEAGLVTAGIGILVIAGCGIVAFVRWYQLREMPRLLYREGPIVNRAHRLAEAFLDGLLAERPPHR